MTDMDPFGVGRVHFWGYMDPFECRWTLLDVCAPFWGRVDPPWCAASSPGTEGCSGNLSLFAGIPMMFPVILGTWSKMELVYQEKEFVAGRLSENEQLGNSRSETQGACNCCTCCTCRAHWVQQQAMKACGTVIRIDLDFKNAFNWQDTPASGQFFEVWGSPMSICSKSYTANHG